MKIAPVAGFVFGVFAVCAPIAAQNRAGISSWLPVTEEDRKIDAPVVDKKASVEGLFWRVHVTDTVTADGVERILNHYARLKVFTAAGRDVASSIDIPYDEQTSILSIAARTTKADGTEIDMRKDDVKDVEVIRAGRLKRNVKRLAMPGVEPGAIIEYRWREIRHKQRSLYLRMNFQREYPIRKVTYYFKPFDREISAGYVAAIRPFNCTPSKMALETDGYNSTYVENVPAFQDEPLMPGEPNVRAWALLFYHADKKREPAKYWEEVGKEAYKDLRESLKASNEVKQATASALQGVAENDKVNALIRYIRKNIRNLFDPSVTDAERATLLKQMPKSRVRTSAEILKSGIAFNDERNIVFAAMATQAGFDARPALAADREDIIFSPELAERLFLQNIDMAIRENDEWHLYDVGAVHLPAGMVTWREEGMAVLISDPKKPVFITSKLSPPTRSLVRRTGRMKLLPDGTLEGELVETHTGHQAGDRRRELIRETEADRKEIVRKTIERTFPSAEVADILLEGVDDPEKPVVIRMTVKLPGYAQRTGKRMFVQPLLFQRGDPPLFTAGERKYDILFRYAWSEDDTISIEIPEGFEPEAVDPPTALPFGKPGSYGLSIVKSGKNRFIWSRRLVFGDNGLIGFEKVAYPNIKRAFDEIHRLDNSVFTLRQTAASATGGVQ